MGSGQWRRRGRRVWPAAGAAGIALTAGLACSPAVASAGHARPASVSPVTEVSQGCRGPNSEVEEATAAPSYVYELWIGCNSIGFAWSADGGLHFSKPMTMPGSQGFSWDPSITVGPRGTVYAAYMHSSHTRMYPIVAASFDHGLSFGQVTSVIPKVKGNWGDRDFIAAGQNGDLYLTWDYGPSAADMKFLCSPAGSCAYKAGDVNGVIQRSTDGGKTWGPIIPVGPGFPRNGGYSVPLVVQPSGRVDTLSWGHYVTPGTYKLHPGHEFFASSATGTSWPSHPLELAPRVGSIALPTWWIDGDLGTDAAGNLYATWDTQTAAGDIGWLSFSIDGGRRWSPPMRVTPDHDSAVHIVEVVGGAPGVAYVGWQTDAPSQGYATYVRPFSLANGWTGPAVRVSTGYGNKRIWPGDTFGIALLPGAGPQVRLAVSWGSAIGTSKNSEIYAAVVTLPAPHR